MIDVTVSATGDAKSLRGGTLLATELKGLDNEVYAVTRMAPISTSSWTVEGNTGSRATKNHPTVGRIPDGAYVERAETAEFVKVIAGQRYVTLNLRNENFANAERIRQAIDQKHPGSSYEQDPGTVRIRVPALVSKLDELKFIDEIQQMQVEVDVPAVVVINERTGTIVVGGNVSISDKTAIAQGGLVIKVKEQQNVVQPTTSFTDGATTAIVDDTAISVEEQDGYLIPVPKTVTVDDLANALNAIGASPQDLIAIFQALAEGGLLQAKIEMM